MKQIAITRREFSGIASDYQVRQVAQHVLLNGLDDSTDESGGFAFCAGLSRVEQFASCYGAKLVGRNWAGRDGVQIQFVVK